MNPSVHASSRPSVEGAQRPREAEPQGFLSCLRPPAALLDRGLSCCCSGASLIRTLADGGAEAGAAVPRGVPSGHFSVSRLVPRGGAAGALPARRESPVVQDSVTAAPFRMLGVGWPGLHLPRGPCCALPEARPGDPSSPRPVPVPPSVGLPLGHLSPPSSPSLPEVAQPLSSAAREAQTQTRCWSAPGRWGC